MSYTQPPSGSVGYFKWGDEATRKQSLRTFFGYAVLVSNASRTVKNAAFGLLASKSKPVRVELASGRSARSHDPALSSRPWNRHSPPYTRDRQGLHSSFRIQCQPVDQTSMVAEWHYSLRLPVGSPRGASVCHVTGARGRHPPRPSTCAPSCCRSAEAGWPSLF